ncbi:MAG: SDR family NAD(P)-dependent oxidoreductase [Rhodospirillaceae bacterium]|nr:SDR family NAD(P)-dependent oxidoreductase [Rhodospirillales bacterium]
MAGRFFLFGLGFSGRVIARQLLEKGWQVAGSTRSGEAVDLPDVTVFPFERGHPLPPGALDGVTHVLSSVPPDGEGDPVLDVMALPDLTWAGYLSTTGVYGDRQGEWVDENAELRPTVDRARRRVAAERQWLDRGAHVFRLAGIYGPGRSAIDSVKDGTARRINKPGQVFSRTHVDDIAQTVLASMARPHPGTAYNVCDDDAAPPQDVIVHAARLLGMEPPPELSWDEAQTVLSPMALSFYADNKRVSNERIKRELGVVLKHPTYREGLAALL